MVYIGTILHCDDPCLHRSKGVDTILLSNLQDRSAKNYRIKLEIISLHPTDRSHRRNR